MGLWRVVFGLRMRRGPLDSCVTGASGAESIRNSALAGANARHGTRIRTASRIRSSVGRTLKPGGANARFILTAFYRHKPFTCCGELLHGGSKGCCRKAIVISIVC